MPTTYTVRPKDYTIQLTLSYGTSASGTDDKRVKVSTNDTTPGFLDTKLVAGSNITITENNDGGNETLTIASTGGGGGASELSDLSDVNTSTPTNRNALMADGTDWESRPLVEADISDFGSYSTTGHTHTSSDITDFTTAVQALSVNSLSDLGLTASTTELNYVDGVTSDIQTQIDGKASTSHTHTHADISDYDTELAGKTNTTAFTPTADYHPATKKYVDDEITGAGGYNDEAAQDAIGTILVDSSTIDLVYNDGTPSITASIVLGSIDETHLDASVNASLDLADSAIQSGDLATVATTGAYSDLSGTPTIPTVDDTAYNATSWNANTDAPTKNAVRDKIETMDSAIALNTAKNSYPSADSTKLAGIEAGADVTDTANVTAAGALMDSEVTNLAQVKSFDSSDYATAAQGATADSAMQNLTDDTTPQLSGELDAQANSIGFTLQTATGDGTTTIDWRNGNKFKFTFGAQNDTFTFTAPSKPGNFLLVLVQDATGGRTATWPGTVKWPGGTAPTLSTGANAEDIVSFFYDGTSYYGVASLDFS